MANNQCIIDDKYCSEMGVYFNEQGKKLDWMVSDYIDVLIYARDKAIKSGEVHDVLNSYIEYAKKLKGKISEISGKTPALISEFLSQIDEADKFLF